MAQVAADDLGVLIYACNTLNSGSSPPRMQEGLWTCFSRSIELRATNNNDPPPPAIGCGTGHNATVIPSRPPAWVVYLVNLQNTLEIVDRDAAIDHELLTSRHLRAIAGRWAVIKGW